MSEFYILLSNKNKYIDHINRIINESDFKINIIDESSIAILKEDDIIYSLITNNDFSVDISKFSKFINKEFYLEKLNKKDVQLLLKNNKINTPLILEEVKVYPVYLKENKHEGIVKNR